MERREQNKKREEEEKIKLIEMMEDLDESEVRKIVEDLNWFVPCIFPSSNVN